MGLFIDLGASNARLSEPEFEAWAAEHTAFISSEMTDLRAEREAVAEALRTAGLQVVLFEDLGGRDEDAQSAYLEGVARSDIYVGIVGDRYGSMLPSGRSPTHEEYRYARERGKRISFWVARDGAKRQGDARDFVSGVQVFHTTGGYTTADDLARGVLERFKEIAADDEAPWVKVGDTVFRALRIRDQGGRVQIAAKVRDGDVARYLVDLRPGSWAGSREIKITIPDNSGDARIVSVEVETTARSTRSIVIDAEIDWRPSRSGIDYTFQGFGPCARLDAGLRAALLGEPLPAALQEAGSFGAPSIDDPLAPLAGLELSPAPMEHIGRLLLVEQLIGTGAATSVDDFTLGPVHHGERRVKLVYSDRPRYSNEEPTRRTIEGVWRAGSA